jgi:hypothetical protein
MSGTREAMLTVARRNVGVVESPRGSNRNPYAALAKHANGQPWCATFLVACAVRAGVKLPSTSAYTPTMAAAFAKAGRYGSRPAVGAFVFFRWPGMGRIAHVGIVEAVHSDGSITTIEGNTDAAGGRSGGRVMRHKRRGSIAGYGYPVYAVPSSRPVLRKGSTGAGVVELQRRLTALGHPLKPDGDFGAATDKAVREVQRKAKLKVDGVVGPGTYRALGLK